MGRTLSRNYSPPRTEEHQSIDTSHCDPRSQDKEGREYVVSILQRDIQTGDAVWRGYALVSGVQGRVAGSCGSGNTL